MVLVKCLLYALLCLACTANADPVTVEVSREAGNTYKFKMQFVANAPVSRVFALITNYDQLAELNPLIKSSRLLPSPAVGVDRVELITEGCILFFCKQIRRVEDVKVDRQLTITSEFVPSLSDFKSGDTQWTFTSHGQTTTVNYQASMVPDFWLPPFVGPYALKKQLHSQLNYTANKINLLLASDAS